MFGLGLFFLVMAILGGLFWRPWRWRRPLGRGPLWRRPMWRRPMRPLPPRRPVRRGWRW